MNINIGGGKGWSYPGWLNLDQREGFKFASWARIPVEDASAEYVYSSHFLEHLDDATVSHVLSEARRVCKGKLVLKLPDFDEVLRRWRAGDEAYFDKWGQQKVWPTWKNLGVPVNIDSKAAMIFCGWWNDAYGDEWGKRTPDAAGAYHGPVQGMLISSALGDCSPHTIASFFRDIARKAVHFNHQNAWSRAELTGLLETHGFSVQTLDAEIACCLPIPTIADQRGISMYAVAS